MVQLEEVEDAELTQAQPGPIDDSEDDADYVDTDSSLSDDDEDYPIKEGESISERIVALKDIIPPPTRRRISDSLSSAYNVSKTVASYSGKGIWILSTTALFLLVPFAVSSSEEALIVEQEREIKARERMGEDLTPGVGAAAGLGGAGSAL